MGFWEIRITNKEIRVPLRLKPAPREGKGVTMSMVLSEVSRVCVFSVFFLEIDINQYSVIEFSVFL